MSSEITPFVYEGQSVRTITDEHGEPWFVISDVAALLEYRDGPNLTRRLDPDDLGTRSASTSAGSRNVTVCNEAGLYDAILGSRVEGARMIKRWVTHEVLPAIRRTGSYGITATIPAKPPTPRELLAQWTAAIDRAEAAERTVLELEPVVAAHDTLTNARGALLVREAAAVLAMTESHLRRWLIEQRMTYSRTAPLCGATVYDRYASHSDHFTVTLHTVRHLRGLCTHQTLHVTPLGMDLITRRRGAL